MYKDWYKRYGVEKHFTGFRGSRSRINWEKTLLKKSSYSSYFWKPKSNYELLKRAYSLAKEFITAMNLPYKVQIKISSASSDSFSTDKRIHVSTKILDETELELGEKLDIFCGLTIHEACHLLYTDFNCFDNRFKILRDSYSDSPSRLFLIKNIFNVIEDERVEELLCEEKPGLGNFLEKTKYWFFDKTFKDNKDSSELSIILTTFLKLVRYPKSIDISILEKYKELFDKIKKLIVPLPNSTNLSIDAAIEIEKLLTQYLPDTKENSIINSLNKKIDTLCAELYDSDDDTYKILSKYLSKEITNTSDGIVVSLELEGYLEKGSKKNVYFEKIKIGDKNQYDLHFNNISKYISSVRSKIVLNQKNIEFISKGFNSGELDTNKLAEAYQGISHIYQRKQKIKTNKISVCILVDESGSMGCFDRQKQGRYYYAVDSAILLNEVFSGIPDINLFIYGHTADDRCEELTEIRVYKEPGVNNKYSLGNISPRKENRDGVAILEVANRVRKFTEDEILYFIISDGIPAAVNYYGESACIDTKNSIEKVSKMGFIPIGICIGEDYYCFKKDIELYKNKIIVENTNELPQKLGLIIKKAYSKYSKSIII